MAYVSRDTYVQKKLQALCCHCAVTHHDTLLILRAHKLTGKELNAFTCMQVRDYPPTTPPQTHSYIRG